MSDKGTREAFEKWMQDKAPKGIDIHSAWEVWLASLAHSAQSQEAQPMACHNRANDYCKCSRNAMLCDGFGPAAKPAQPAGAPESHSAKAGSGPADAVAEYADYMKAADLAGEHPHSPDAFDSIKAFLLSNKQPAQQAPVSAMTDERIDSLNLAIGYIASSERGDRNVHVSRIRALLSTAHSKQERVMTDSYVQTVPDKCDRIVWRNQYIHLPISTAHSSDTERDKALEEAAKIVGGMHPHTFCGHMNDYRSNQANAIAAIRALKSQPSSLPPPQSITEEE